MGRRKIQIAPIQEDRNRNVTFGKRRNGIFKKAFELGVLCQVDVAVLVWSHTGKLHVFSSHGEMQTIMDRYKAQDRKHIDLVGPSYFGHDGSSGTTPTVPQAQAGKKVQAGVKRRKSADDSDEDEDEDEVEDDEADLPASKNAGSSKPPPPKRSPPPPDEPMKYAPSPSLDAQAQATHISSVPMTGGTAPIPTSQHSNSNDHHQHMGRAHSASFPGYYPYPQAHPQHAPYAAAGASYPMYGQNPTMAAAAMYSLATGNPLPAGVVPMTHGHYQQPVPGMPSSYPQQNSQAPDRPPEQQAYSPSMGSVHQFGSAPAPSIPRRQPTLPMDAHDGGSSGASTPYAPAPDQGGSGSMGMGDNPPDRSRSAPGFIDNYLSSPSILFPDIYRQMSSFAGTQNFGMPSHERESPQKSDAGVFRWPLAGAPAYNTAQDGLGMETRQRDENDGQVSPKSAA